AAVRGLPYAALRHSRVVRRRIAWHAGRHRHVARARRADVAPMQSGEIGRIDLLGTQRHECEQANAGDHDGNESEHAHTDSFRSRAYGDFFRYASMAAVASRSVASTAFRPRINSVSRKPYSSPSRGRVP